MKSCITSGPGACFTKQFALELGKSWAVQNKKKIYFGTAPVHSLHEPAKFDTVLVLAFIHVLGTC